MPRWSRHSINISEVQKLTGLSRATIYHALEEPSRARSTTLERLRQAGVDVVPRAALIIPAAVREFALNEGLTLREVEQLLNMRLKPVRAMTVAEVEHVWRSAKVFSDLYWVNEGRE